MGEKVPNVSKAQSSSTNMERKVTMNKVDEFLERKLAERQNEIFEANKKKKSFWGNFNKKKSKPVNAKTPIVPKQQIPPKPRLSPEQQLVMDLFNKIKDNFISNGSDKSLPSRISISRFGIDLIFDDNSKKSLAFSDYITRDLNVYTSWWCSDGTEGKGALNEQMLLADEINKLTGNNYNIYDKNRKSESKISSDVKMVYFAQESIEMSKK